MLQVHRFPKVLDVHATEAVKVRPEDFVNYWVHKIMHSYIVEFGWARSAILPPTPVYAEASCA